MRLFLAFIFSFSLFAAFGQDDSAITSDQMKKPIFQVHEGDRDLLDGSSNALTVDLPEIKSRTAEKIWKDYIDKFGGKTKKDRKVKGYKTENTEIYAIGGLQKMNVYARVEEEDDRVTLTAWFDTPKGMLRSDSDSKGYLAAEKFLQDYALEVKIAQVEEDLEDEEKALKNLEHDMDRLKRDNEGYHKDIENAKDRIKKAEDNIVENERDQESTSAKLDEQEQKLSKVRERLAFLKK
ncbi:MAG: hypothetical protein K9I85_09040 [Saprospiraceae bacterium]|nr:hypothetical protein [Saprospiraceae bacterium]